MKRKEFLKEVTKIVREELKSINEGKDLAKEYEKAMFNMINAQLRGDDAIKELAMVGKIVKQIEQSPEEIDLSAALRKITKRVEAEEAKM